jgi:hypothetical protein
MKYSLGEPGGLDAHCPRTMQCSAHEPKDRSAPFERICSEFKLEVVLRVFLKCL